MMCERGTPSQTEGDFAQSGPIDRLRRVQVVQAIQIVERSVDRFERFELFERWGLPPRRKEL
jgi:hypothetical protein